MPRYIDVDKLLQEIDRIYREHFAKSKQKVVQDIFNAIFKRINNAPTADVAPVVHARWIKLGEADYQCSSCGFRFTSGEDISEFKHCRCGAKMDG